MNELPILLSNQGLDYSSPPILLTQCIIQQEAANCLLCNEKMVLGRAGHACDTRLRSRGVRQCPYCDLRASLGRTKRPSIRNRKTKHLKPVSGIGKRVTLSLDAHFAFYRTCCSFSLSLLVLVLTGCVRSGETVT